MKRGRKPRNLPMDTPEQRREAWGQRQEYRRRRFPATYDELSKRFAGTETLSQIAESYGVTRERIRQINNLYFPDVQSPKARQHARTEASWATSDRLNLPCGLAAKVARLAEAAGCVVEASVNIALTGTRRRQLVINGHFCDLSYADKTTLTSPKGRTWYWRFNLGRGYGSSYAVFLCRTGRGYEVFVAPRELVRHDEYIPTRPPSYYNGITPRIDWWRDYHNAWPKKAEVAR